jgi:hypothetical protein
MESLFPKRDPESLPLVPQSLPFTQRILRVVLSNDWYACDWSNGTVQAYDLMAQNVLPIGPTDSNTVFEDQSAASYSLTLFDADGIITGELLAQQDPDGEFYLPAGTNCKVYLPEDSQDGHWELVAPGTSCRSGSGSSGSEGSEGSSGSGSHACPFPVTGHALHYPGYNPAVEQFLGHDNQGCWVWIDWVKCPTSGSGSGG